jgi:hypothetical protein
MKGGELNEQERAKQGSNANDAISGGTGSVYKNEKWGACGVAEICKVKKIALHIPPSIILS